MVVIGDTFPSCDSVNLTNYTLCSSHDDHHSNHTQKVMTSLVTCDVPVRGRYVVLYLETGSLIVCEMEVYGFNLAGENYG